jgi:Uma2 family endonuclease
MSAQPAPQRLFTIEEYLEREEAALVKSEYYKGEIFEMSGGTPRHVGIASNIIAALQPKLQTKQCRAFGSDLKVHIPENFFFTYPDVTVVCGKREYFKDSALKNPLVIIEVLSDSTESYDRGTKFRLYRSIASLQEYVLISQKEQLVEIFRRNPHGRWELYIYADNTDIEFAALECILPMAEIYADLDEI